MSNKPEDSADMNHSDKQGQKNKSLAWKLFALAAMFFCAFIYATWTRGN